MRITLAAVGRLKSGPMRALYDDYAGRLRRGPLGPLRLKEIEAPRGAGVQELKRREGALVLAAVPAGARLIALDEAGTSLTSREFAALLGRWRDEGVGEVAFAVGGAEGLDEAVHAAAAMTLSFGPLTWPHLLVRVLLAEQLYRAQSILTGHPYHRA
ncbi:MAG: 23S rRNA (pseudouridine(1915)-N(3))-methyltransferase RlmH [Alphaproteobacteria bacterium]|nr:MAG: 23S rRNA (pseudouridine(1915)-N(3))-methyltransferase RlmH [Alphaproteobacteria bacterium]